MITSENFIELTAKLQNLFVERDNSYTLCVVVGEIECNLLRFLHKVNRPLKMNEIAKMYNVSNTKVTRILNKLVRMGFVERYIAEDDRRSCYAKIMEIGAKMAENTKYMLNQFQKDVLSRIPQEELENTYRYLKLYTDAYAETIANAEDYTMNK
ncbi:MAG: MarR family transcriptional regulator [Candidatus Cloacimonadales bacterium]|nr:MarR family transcriptional regulator [Candidatus Cloacimonadales bacterium]